MNSVAATPDILKGTIHFQRHQALSAKHTETDTHDACQSFAHVIIQCFIFYFQKMQNQRELLMYISLNVHKALESLSPFQNYSITTKLFPSKLLSLSIGFKQQGGMGKAP